MYFAPPTDGATSRELTFDLLLRAVSIDPTLRGGDRLRDARIELYSDLLVEYAPAPLSKDRFLVDLSDWLRPLLDVALRPNAKPRARSDVDRLAVLLAEEIDDRVVEERLSGGARERTRDAVKKRDAARRRRLRDTNGR